MEINVMGLKRLPISHLLLIMLDKNTVSYMKTYAEIELKKRIKNSDIEIEDLIKIDSENIKERGLDVNNYLFGPNPTMQQLMEFYFKYSNEETSVENKLLLSERHLCNNMNFGSSFFDKICKQEINNLNKRIEISKTKEDITNLVTAKNILLDRTKKIEEEKRKHYKGIEIITFNEAAELLGDACIEFGYNISMEEEYKRNSSYRFIVIDSIIEALDDTILDYDIVQDLYVLKKVLTDSSKLNKQKRILLNQVRKEYQVDYSSQEMQKALSRTRTK